MKKIAIINQKGGSGKTTTACNLGSGLSRLKKKTLLIDLVIIFVVLIPPLYAEENNVIYNTLMINYTAMTWADFSITYYNLDQGREELNPIARLYIDKPGVAITFLVLDNLIVSYASHEMYKRNKVAAIGLMVLVTIAKGYILYRNLQELR